MIDSVPEKETLPGLRWQRARASSNLGTLPWRRYSDTKESVDKATAAKGLERVHSAKEALERLSEEFPGVPAYREELALVGDFIGQHERGKTGRAALERALNLSRNLAERFPTVPKYHVLHSDVCRSMARELLSQQDPAGASRLCSSRLTNSRLRRHTIPICPNT